MCHLARCHGQFKLAYQSLYKKQQGCALSGSVCSYSRLVVSHTACSYLTMWHISAVLYCRQAGPIDSYLSPMVYCQLVLQLHVSANSSTSKRLVQKRVAPDKQSQKILSTEWLILNGQLAIKIHVFRRTSGRPDTVWAMLCFYGPAWVLPCSDTIMHTASCFIFCTGLRKLLQASCWKSHAGVSAITAYMVTGWFISLMQRRVT